MSDDLTPERIRRMLIKRCGTAFGVTAGVVLLIGLPLAIMGGPRAVALLMVLSVAMMSGGLAAAAAGWSAPHRPRALAWATDTYTGRAFHREVLDRRAPIAPEKRDEYRALAADFLVQRPWSTVPQTFTTAGIWTGILLHIPARGDWDPLSLVLTALATVFVVVALPIVLAIGRRRVRRAREFLDSTADAPEVSAP